MCQQIEALAALTEAANALTRACHCRIEAVSISLHQVFDVRLGDPVPPAMTELFGRIGRA